MCVDSADVIYSLFSADKRASIRLWHATDNAAAQAHHERLVEVRRARSPPAQVSAAAHA